MQRQAIYLISEPRAVQNEVELQDIIHTIFRILFNTDDLRQIWRDTAPLHELSQEQKKRAQKLALKIKEDTESILRSLER